MGTYDLNKGFGKGNEKIISGSASLADGDTLDAGLSTIDSVILTAVAASGNYAIAFIHSISGGNITIGLYGAATGAAPAALSTATTIYYQITGY